MNPLNLVRNSLNYALVKYSYDNKSTEMNMIQYADSKCPIKYLVYHSPLLNKIFYIPTDKLYHTEKTYQPIKSWREIYTSLYS
jgi:hypothetical protein